MKRKIAAIFAADIAGYSRLALKAASEQDAVNSALANCAKQDSNCHIIAIGPYVVEPNEGVDSQAERAL